VDNYVFYIYDQLNIFYLWYQLRGEQSLFIKLHVLVRTSKLKKYFYIQNFKMPTFSNKCFVEHLFNKMLFLGENLKIRSDLWFLWSIAISGEIKTFNLFFGSQNFIFFTTNLLNGIKKPYNFKIYFVQSNDGRTATK